VLRHQSSEARRRGEPRAEGAIEGVIAREHDLVGHATSFRAVGTVKKSMDAGEPRWLSRKVRQIWDGGLRGLGGRRRERIRSPMSMPSLSSSPWILGAPHSGFAPAIWRISCLISGGTLPLDGPGEHEDRRVIGRLLAPPAAPALVGPRPADRAEHVASEDPRSDAVESSRRDVLIEAGLTLARPVHALEGPRVEEPIEKLRTAQAERMLEVLTGARAEPIDGNRERMNP